MASLPSQSCELAAKRVAGPVAPPAARAAADGLAALAGVMTNGMATSRSPAAAKATGPGAPRVPESACGISSVSSGTGAVVPSACGTIIEM